MSEQKRVAARAYYRMLAERAARAGKARVVTVIVHEPHQTPFQRAHAAADARVTPESLAEWQAESAALNAMLPKVTVEALELPPLGEVSNSPLRRKSPRVRRIMKND